MTYDLDSLSSISTAHGMMMNEMVFQTVRILVRAIAHVTDVRLVNGFLGDCLAAFLCLSLFVFCVAMDEMVLEACHEL